MATIAKKPPGMPGTPTGPTVNRRPSPNLHSPSNLPNVGLVARASAGKAPSVVSRPTRPAVRRPGSVILSNGVNVSNSVEESSNKDEDAKIENAKIENAALIDDLKKSLRSAELMSEDYQQQLTTTQKRLDEMMRDHVKLEENFHETSGKIEELEAQKKEAARQARETINSFESGQEAMLRDREEQIAREAELKATIQRLKDTVADRERRVGNQGMSPSRKGRSASIHSDEDQSNQFAPPGAVQRPGSSERRSESKSNSRLVMQKDMLIESLRLELAEVQIKLVELENADGGRVQELERTLLETRMANARLMEDNESFQLLLSERTLSGDFTKMDFMQSSMHNAESRLGSLAEELESAEGESENYRRLEADTKALRDQNKALTLYIEKIISRVLQHDSFEKILDQKDSGVEDAPPKDLPSPPSAPPVKEIETQPHPSLLQRAMSGPGRRQRPQSHIGQITGGPSAHEDPSTAPSIPITRGTVMRTLSQGHRRTQSEKPDHGNAAAVVNQMYRPSPSPVSPNGGTQRNGYFTANVFSGNPLSRQSSSGSRKPSGVRRASGVQTPAEKVQSSSNSSASQDSRDSPSPPRNSAGNTTYPGAVMTQSKLRPLRLVQESEEALAEEEAAKKKANRGSWFGWMNKGQDGGSRSTSLGSVSEIPKA